MHNHLAGGQDMLFKTLVSSVPVGITVFRGADFIVEMANRRYLEIVDKTEDEFVGRSLFDSLPEVRSAVEPLLKSVLETGKPFHGYEFPVTLNRYGHSETTYFNFTYQPAADENGNINGVIVVANEVTELVKAKHLIAESETQFRNLVMQSPIAMAIFKGESFVIDMANTILYEKIWRRTPEEVLGKSILEVFPELKQQKFPELLKEVFKTGKVHRENEAEAFVEGADGMKRFFLDFEYAPLRLPDNTIWGIMVTVNDVTERVEARKKLEAAFTELQIFKFIADNVMDFICVCDLDTRPSYINPSGMQLVGLDDITTAQNTLLIDYFLEEERHYVTTELLQNVMKEGAAETEIRFRHFRTGEDIWMLCNIILLRDLTGEPIGFASVSKDITQQRASINELEQRVLERTQELVTANRELERSNEDLQQFAHVASHDLKEPVRKIKTFSMRLQDDFAEIIGPKGAGYLTKIIQSTNRIYAMIEGVLTYSYANATDLPTQNVYLSEIIDSIATDLELPMKEKTARIDYTSLPVVNGVPHLLYQLFYNLINNSLKFSSTERSAVITIEHMRINLHGQDYEQIILADNGIGFENEFSEKIFSTFIRLHSKDKYEGTGLGLALSKKIVQFHQGFISASGEKNKGATFTILLPFKENPDA